MIKQFIVNNLNFLGKYKRFAVALKDTLISKESYSQHKEDIWIYNFLTKKELNNSVYVDIGANHPTDISNTYLLYKKGLKGIVIEPNIELINLFKIFRKRDIRLNVGCSDKTQILPFYISKTPVLSTFQNNRNQTESINATNYLPVLKLDDIMLNMSYSFINLLSIDVEGLNFEVLVGAKETIKKSMLICLEYDNEQDKKKYIDFLGTNFNIVKEFGCNIIFENTQLLKN